MGFLGHMVTLYSQFGESVKCSTKWHYHFAFSLAVCKNSDFSTFSHALVCVIVVVFIITILMCINFIKLWYIIVVLICILLMVNESLGLQGDPTSPFWRIPVLGVHWKDWRWGWNSSTLATSCEELTPWKRPWCWEGLGAGGEGDDRGWDGWMASLTRWLWVWVNSRSWWWTGRPGVLWFMGLQRVGHNWATELNWTEWHWEPFHVIIFHLHILHILE